MASIDRMRCRVRKGVREGVRYDTKKSQSKANCWNNAMASFFFSLELCWSSGFTFARSPYSFWLFAQLEIISLSIRRVWQLMALHKSMATRVNAVG